MPQNKLYRHTLTNNAEQTEHYLQYTDKIIPSAFPGLGCHKKMFLHQQVYRQAVKPFMYQYFEELPK
jgi:hypothetical protein